MMKRIVKNTHEHPLKDQKSPKIDKVPLCTSCSLGKLIARSSPLKVENESPMFLERIQGNICGPIHPPCRPFRYFMVLIDASSRWSHVSLLSTRNVAFAKFLAQIIKLRAHFTDYTVKRVRLDNVGEFTSHALNDYCMSVRIVVEHLVAPIHTQNGLAESLIKRLQLIARPLIMRTKLPVSMWGHAILHAAALIRMRPSVNHKYSPIQLASGQEPNISHLRIFGCVVYVSIAPPQRTKMGTQRRLGIYVGNETSSIIRYIEPLTCDLFTQAGDNVAQESRKRLKRGRPIGLKDKNPRKRKGTEKNSGHDENVLYETQDIKASPKKEMNDINKEIDIMSSDDDPEPKSVIDCQSRPDWDKWKDAMQAELNSLNKRKEKPLSTPMVGRSLNVDNDLFRPCEDDEEVLGPEVPYLSAIGALMYLTNCTRHDLSFAVNLLARFSSSPTKRHWNGIKHILRYLRGTVDLGLFYPNDSKEGLVGYADAGYLSDPHKARSQTGYVFLKGGTAISWRSQKQTLVATSSNHAKVIALHEASRECV
ncbi:retrovirus-related pol polyprotein from transposon TNT 1-94 [Tanacetum coccineum]